MKALRTAAFVVGAVAVVATGLGAVGLGVAGVAAGTFAAVGTYASAGAGLLSLASVAAAPKGTLGGSATKFTIDKESGIPYIAGRTYSGGRVVHRQYYDDPNSKMRNQRESWVVVHSIGPVNSIGPLLIDKTTPVTFDSSGAATGSYAGNMWLVSQLGACPEPAALAGPTGPFPGWDASSKLSGLAADLWTLDFDSKGKKFPNGVPERGRIVEGVLVYDARLDSTYPGGSGTCRIGQEATYVYSENPACHAVTWAYGRFQNGVRMAGGEMPVTGIDLASFVEWSNVCLANQWSVGGVVFTDDDDAWDVLRMICQAGGAEPIVVGGMLSVTFSAPRVAIGTITSEDLMGEVSVPGGVSKRIRRNTVIPTIRLESHGWEMVPLDPIVVPEYVTVDGGSRPKPITYPLVQDEHQGAQLAAYDILNSRELDPIELPCKVYMIGYRPGDLLTAQIPEALLDGVPVLVRQRQIAAGSLGVTFTCRSETAGKHDFALGRTGTPPPTPSLTAPAGNAAPDASDWTLTGTSFTKDGASVPAIVIDGATGTLAAEAVLFDYRVYASGLGAEDGWIAAGIDTPEVTRKEITSVSPATQYQASVRYRTRNVVSDRLVLGPVTAGDLNIPADNVSGLPNTDDLAGLSKTAPTDVSASKPDLTHAVVGWRNPGAPTFAWAQIVRDGTLLPTQYIAAPKSVDQQTISVPSGGSHTIVVRAFFDGGATFDSEGVEVS